MPSMRSKYGVDHCVHLIDTPPGPETHIVRRGAYQGHIGAKAETLFGGIGADQPNFDTYSFLLGSRLTGGKAQYDWVNSLHRINASISCVEGTREDRHDLRMRYVGRRIERYQMMKRCGRRPGYIGQYIGTYTVILGADANGCEYLVAGERLPDNVGAGLTQGQPAILNADAGGEAAAQAQEIMQRARYLANEFGAVAELLPDGAARQRVLNSQRSVDAAAANAARLALLVRTSTTHTARILDALSEQVALMGRQLDLAVSIHLTLDAADTSRRLDELEQLSSFDAGLSEACGQPQLRS